MRGLRAYLKNDSRKGHASCPCDAILSWPPKSSLEAGYTHLTDGETEARSLSSSECYPLQLRVYFFLVPGLHWLLSFMPANREAILLTKGRGHLPRKPSS